MNSTNHIPPLIIRSAHLLKFHHRTTNVEVLRSLLDHGLTAIIFLEKMLLVLEDGPTSPSWANTTIWLLLAVIRYTHAHLHPTSTAHTINKAGSWNHKMNPLAYLSTHTAKPSETYKSPYRDTNNNATLYYCSWMVIKMTLMFLSPKISATAFTLHWDSTTTKTLMFPLPLLPNPATSSTFTN
jgi:hypothetical protein